MARFPLFDAIIYVALAYLAISQYVSFDKYASCPEPIHIFNFVNYITLFALRFLQLLAGRFSIARGFPPDSCEALTAKRVLGTTMVFFTAWNIVGTVWVAAPGMADCMPQKNELYRTVTWIILCYLLILLVCIHVFSVPVVLLLRRVGVVREPAVPSGAPRPNPGLSREDIAAIPLIYARDLVQSRASDGNAQAQYSDPAQEACVICLDEFEAQALKKLPRCEHAFHASCIDSWLRQHNTCPSCRVVVPAVVTEQQAGIRLGRGTRRAATANGSSASSARARPPTTARSNQARGGAGRGAAVAMSPISEQKRSGASEEEPEAVDELLIDLDLIAAQTQAGMQAQQCGCFLVSSSGY